MTSDHSERNRSIYKNPVFPHSFPDPFVIKHNGEYFAYCTGHWTDGRVFGVLLSRDLIDWEPLGGAMAPVDDPAPFYWAPEVTYSNGTFYLYYSMGNETLMHMRVATSDRPDGGFVDSGRRLTDQDFAIDGHVFIDDDGERYFFYATDFLDHTHIGTGIVADPMIDWFTLAGEPQPIVRAKYDWQVYDPARKEKGGVRWHTVEGPYVLKRKGVYFVMFSGGNWQNLTYGVSFATTERILPDGEWDQYCDGEKLLPILRTYPDKLIGPGHNSVVIGPNNRELYCVYHCWEGGHRVLAVNRMDIIGRRMAVESEPFREKLRPHAPVTVPFDAQRWTAEGESARSEKRASFPLSAPASLTLSSLPSAFLCETAFSVTDAADGGRFGIRLSDERNLLGQLTLGIFGNELRCGWNSTDGHPSGEFILLEAEFTFGAWNRLRLEADEGLVRVRVNETQVPIDRWLPGTGSGLSLFADGAALDWLGFAITEGFENRFEPAEGASLQKLGWRASDPDVVVFGDGELRLIGLDREEVTLNKGPAREHFEFVAVVRSVETDSPDGLYGFTVTDVSGSSVARFDIRAADGRFCMFGDSQAEPFQLPLEYQPGNLHRFGFTKLGNELLLDLDLMPIGSVPLAVKEACVGIHCSHSEIAVESVRFTVLNGPG